MARIIVVDDDEIVGSILSDTLIDAGHSVGWLEDGREALKVMERRPPNLTILDQNMPQMHGRDVLRAMRSHAELVMVPVLMLTAVTGAADEQISFYEGADHYMTKPFDPQEVLFWAEELIAKKITRISAADRILQA